MWLMILFNYLSYTVFLIRLGLNKYGQPDSCNFCSATWSIPSW